MIRTAAFVCLVAMAMSVLAVVAPTAGPGAGVAAAQAADESLPEESLPDESLFEQRRWIVTTHDEPAQGAVLEAPQGPGPSIQSLSVSASDALLAEHAIDAETRFEHVIDGFAAELDAETVAALRNDPRVQSVEPDRLMHLQAEQIDPTWGLDRIDEVANIDDDVYVYDYDGTGVHVYVVDSGLNSAHTEFTGRIGSGVNVTGGGASTDDCVGHGTHVASTAVGTDYGVAKNATIHPVRIFQCDGSTPNSVVIAGLDWVADNFESPAVVNLSIGGFGSAAMNSAVDNLVELGLTVVAAAGNDNMDACAATPASEPRVITVGATTSSDRRASYSNWGVCVDIFAPGDFILGASIGSSTATRTLRGTSMSTPHVAGVAALVLEQHPGATPQQVMDLILEESTPDLVDDAYRHSPNRILHSRGFSSVLPPTIEIQPNFDQTVDTAVNGSLVVSGGDSPPVFSATGFPPGLEFSSSGEFSGTATARGRFGPEIEVEIDGRTYYRRFQWRVRPQFDSQPFIESFVDDLTVVAGENAEVWFHGNDVDLDFLEVEFASSTLDIDDSLNGQTPGAVRANLSSVPLGEHELLVRAVDERENESTIRTLNVTAVASLPEVNPQAAVNSLDDMEIPLGQPVSFSLGSELGGVAVFGLSQLPPGLTLDPATGVVSGTPEAVGVFDMRATVGNRQGDAVSTRALLTVVDSEIIAPDPSASLVLSCLGGDGRLDLEITNPTGSSIDAVVHFGPLASRTVPVAADSTAVSTTTGRPDGPFLVRVEVGGETIFNVTEDVTCDPPPQEITIQSSCLANNGRVDVDILNTTGDFASYQVNFGPIQRGVGLSAGFDFRLSVTGRPDGDLPVDVMRDGNVIESLIIPIACDPMVETEVTVGCLAGNGRIDVKLLNLGDGASDYEVAVGALTPRLRSLDPGDRTTVTVTGRADGPYDVVVMRDGEASTFPVEIDCDPDPEPTDPGAEVSVLSACLGGNGRLDAVLSNNTDSLAVYEVRFGSLSPRTRSLAAGATTQLTTTGRPDGPFSVVVMRNGTEIYNDDTVVMCDA